METSGNILEVFEAIYNNLPATFKRVVTFDIIIQCVGDHRRESILHMLESTCNKTEFISEREHEAINFFTRILQEI
jgi:hypothetical protein